MSRIKYVVTPKGINKPSMTNTNAMGKDEVCKLLNKLERQLAEAREFEKRIKHHCQAYENTGNAWFNMNRIYKEVEQLKEQD